jgi:hypothetical protein
MRRLSLILGIAAWCAGAGAAAHPGALDSYGCHPNIAHGTWHCHTGPLAGREFDTREDMVRAWTEHERRSRPKPVRPARAF